MILHRWAQQLIIDPLLNSGTKLHRRHRVFVVSLVMTAAVLAFCVPTANADTGDSRARPIDGVFTALEDISYFTDCDDGTIRINCGGVPGYWPAGSIPVQICTRQFARPSHITAEEFRTFVRETSEMWTSMEAAIGFLYNGDCTGNSRWEDDNYVNEVGFDDSRDVVSGAAVAIARGTWINKPIFGFPLERRFVEFDVVVDVDASIPDICVRSVVAHELGHVIGLGHSSVETDLMFNSFDANDLSTCPTTASSDEKALLQQLYGVNSAPVLQVATEQVFVPGAKVRLIADASDPENDPIVFEWEQIGGELLAFEAIGAELTFIAPEDPIDTIEFRVTARDSYRHLDTETIQVTFDDNPSPLILSPSFTRFQLGNGSLVGNAVLGWSGQDRASSYRFCTKEPFTNDEKSCADYASPQVAVDWDTVIATAGESDERRVFTAGVLETSMAACNAVGCTAAGVGPSIGGLQWASWQIDFDYLAMSFDVPRLNIMWTIGGVVNVETTPRRFEMYIGTPADPLQERIKSCGNLPAGGVCFGLLTPKDKMHLSQLTIVSSGKGTPTTEHRVKIR